jgi:uroporphyrin-III C-methyltransferase/precorrin-2 dehydrogenase/sirohydrochlorin ferrochelatase
VPVNIVDTPAISTFSFGSIVNRSPVVVGVSTAGAAPVLGQAIRARIEALLHPALGEWAAAARRLRGEVSRRLAMGPWRRDIWGRFAEAALTARSGPGGGELAALQEPVSAKSGSVALVGAGPGDPELLTLKALRTLQSADVIFYDRLVSPEILELARREARRMLVGKVGDGPSCRQDEINALMVRLACEGRRVVRLKGGDPMVFGRAAEEMEACRAAGIPVEVVPGITAALGAAAALQIPLTDRRVARRLQFVTGHSERGALPDYDWTSLADPGATTVLYMGSKTLTEMLPKLIDAGLDPLTPSVAVASATMPRSSHVRCALRDMPEALARMKHTGPCIIMIGKVCANAQAADLRDWMETRTDAGAASAPAINLRTGP